MPSKDVVTYARVVPMTLEQFAEQQAELKSLNNPHSSTEAALEVQDAWFSNPEDALIPFGLVDWVKQHARVRTQITSTFIHRRTIESSNSDGIKEYPGQTYRYDRAVTLHFKAYPSRSRNSSEGYRKTPRVVSGHMLVTSLDGASPFQTIKITDNKISLYAQDSALPLKSWVRAYDIGTGEYRWMLSLERRMFEHFEPTNYLNSGDLFSPLSENFIAELGSLKKVMSVMFPRINRADGVSYNINFHEISAQPGQLLTTKEVRDTYMAMELEQKLQKLSSLFRDYYSVPDFLLCYMGPMREMFRRATINPVADLRLLDWNREFAKMLDEMITLIQQDKS
jgi:hypothetical protein